MIGGTLTIALRTKKRNNCISGKEYCHIRQKKSPLMNGTLKLEFSIILARVVLDIRIRPDFDEKPDIWLSRIRFFKKPDIRLDIRNPARQNTAGSGY